MVVLVVTIGPSAVVDERGDVHDGVVEARGRRSGGRAGRVPAGRPTAVLGPKIGSSTSTATSVDGRGPLREALLDSRVADLVGAGFLALPRA